MAFNSSIWTEADLSKQLPISLPQVPDEGGTKCSKASQNGPPNNMKRHIDPNIAEALKNKGENVGSSSDTRPHTKRRSMNPSPAPARQLSSPLGRSFPSPTSVNFQSPSEPQYSTAPQAINLPLPSSLHQSTASNYLSPIVATHSPDSARRDHAAALQHVVSIQKIALSSLQGEHDKLLAAFSRSQTQASALEKKYGVSDNEIISWTEEKLRLRNQVIELERGVDELSRSRDEYKKAAVEERSQYVEIVKKASRLEEMAAEERNSWTTLREDMERQINSLSGGRNREDGTRGINSASAINPYRRLIDDIDIDKPTSSVDILTEAEIEPTNEAISTAPPSLRITVLPESVEDLKDEILRLRQRCVEVEDVLRIIRDDSHCMEGSCEGSTGTSHRLLR